MPKVRPQVSISCSASTSELGSAISSELEKFGYQVALDTPLTFSHNHWGVENSTIIDSVFDDNSMYCILLLDRGYAADKNFHYKRAKLHDVIFRRRGFVLPVQVGDDQIEIHGLTNHLGKLRVSPGDSGSVLAHFLEKVDELSAISDSVRQRAGIDRVLNMYNDNLDIAKIDYHLEKSRKIGYELYSAFDAVTNQVTFFLSLFEGCAIRATFDELKLRHASLLKSGKLIVITPRERGQVQLDRRLTNIKNSMKEIANVFYLEDFIWEHCTPSIFHEPDPPFEIAGFVEPSIDAPEEESAIAFLKSWHHDHPTPILIIRGPGGIGKTTLAQQFSNELIKTSKAKIFFIDDDSIVEYFLTSPDEFKANFTIYDAYKAYVAQWGRGAHVDVLSYDLFMLNFDSGNFTITIDGLDQVVARLGSSFSVENFLDSMYSSDPASKRKIIISCRSVFLPESYFSHQISMVDVLPFDDQKAAAFLAKRFPDMSNVVKRGMRMASALTQDGDGKHFYPFLLDIVANLLLSEIQNRDGDDSDIEATYENSNNLLLDQDNDYIIYRVCVRESRKYPHGFSPDEQISFLMDLAVIYRGAANEEACATISRNVLSRDADNLQISAMLANPLLTNNSGVTSFRYDVVREHIKCAFVGKVFSGHKAITGDVISLLSERNKFSRDFLKEITRRITIQTDDLMLLSVGILGKIDELCGPGFRDEKSRAKTTVILVVMQSLGLLGQSNREASTRVLTDLFGNGGTLDGISLVDVREKVNFDFRGVHVINSEFVNFECFWECEFDEITMFQNSLLKSLRRPPGMNISARRGNFDLNSCTVDSSIIDAIADQAEKVASGKQQFVADSSGLLKIFYKSGRLYPQREDLLRTKYRGVTEFSDVFLILKLSEIVEEFVNEKATLGKQSRVTPQYSTDVQKFILEGHLSDRLKRALGKTGRI